MPQINSDIINILLEYIWIPVLLPLIIIFLKSVLRVKEIKKELKENGVKQLTNFFPLKNIIN